MKMYKFPSKQINFNDFNQPLGLMMNPDNRWVKKAALIPWDELEQEYAKLFRGKSGQVAKPLRLALGALMIQAEYGYSDDEIVQQIRENPYLQFFCGLPGYEDKKPFEASFMRKFRKRLPPDILNMANGTAGKDGCKSAVKKSAARTAAAVQMALNIEE